VRYRRYKPTKAEVRAAMEVYKPLEGNMPEEINNPEIYKPGRCWWTYKGRKLDVPQHTCAAPATLYIIKPTTDNHKSDGPAFCQMWLCDRHKKEIEKKGFNAKNNNTGN
jgi:hypothetical protein